MPAKGGPKIPQEPPLHPYEELRLRQCMQNAARLQQLGITGGLSDAFTRASAISKEKNKTNRKSREDSESDYDPLQDDTAEHDLVHDAAAAKGSKGNNNKKTTKENSDVPIGVKFRSRKRVYAEILPTQGRRSERIVSQHNASLPPSGNHVSTSSHHNVSQAVEPADDGADAITGSTDAILQADGSNNLSNEDCFDEHLDNAMAGSADVMTQPATNNHMTNEEEEEWNRGVNMGHGLERMNRSNRGKLPVVIPKGHIRPLVPIIAAKYATECNIAVRNHVPVLRHWKDYKDNKAMQEHYLGILRAKFYIDTTNAVVRHGCIEMMKSAVRQWRHKLKHDYFDSFPLHLVLKTSPLKSTSNEQWMDLVELWKTPKKMAACRKNKDNRGKVKFHQTTGSCSYSVFVENLADGDEDEYNEPDALELFKVCHYSKKKKCFTPAVQSVITEIENQMAAPPAEGEEPKSKVQVVAEVLDNNTKNNQFLQNVGMQTVRRPRLSARNAAAQLEAEKMENVELRSVISKQSKQMEEIEQARIRDKEDMRKKHDELEAKLELFMGRN